MENKDQNRIFSNNLNALLSKSGKTQREVAKAIGVLPSTFNTWCKGIALPRMGKVQLLADYFHVTKSALIDEAPINNELLQRTLSPDEAGLLDDYQKLNSLGKEKARGDVSDLTEIPRYTEDSSAEEENASA